MKWHDSIGYSVTEETRPGVWTNTIIEKKHYGEVIKNYRSFSQPDKANDDISLNNQVRIIANPYAINNLYAMKYVVIKGTKWKISSIDASQYPSLTLTLGGIFNGEDET